MLNSKVDVSALAAQYLKSRRLDIANILQDQAANAIFDALAENVPWQFTYREHDKQQIMAPGGLEALEPDKQAALGQRIFASAQSDFQYAYYMHSLVDLYFREPNSNSVLIQFLKFLNSAPMLDFIMAVTGERPIVRASPQATLYAPGHFLSGHTDEDGQAGRRVAFVFSFAHGWRPDWGGMLQFLNAHGDVEQGILPRFNHLHIFTVPQSHLVSYVASYAPTSRLSISGWFLDATAVPTETKAKYGR
jgi:Rps23 Pro-64 3,4-dihydroxylase Tpa1-like proline 4-hydroxylase